MDTETTSRRSLESLVSPIGKPRDLRRHRPLTVKRKSVSSGSTTGFGRTCSGVTSWGCTQPSSPRLLGGVESVPFSSCRNRRVRYRIQWNCNSQNHNIYSEIVWIETLLVTSTIIHLKGKHPLRRWTLHSLLTLIKIVMVRG